MLVNREVEKDLGALGGQALDKRARHLYGSALFNEDGSWDNTSGECTGVSWHGGGGSIPAKAEVHLVEEANPDFTNIDQLLSDLAKPTCDIDGTDPLQINTDIGSEVSGDTYVVTADPSDEKKVKMVLGIDDTSGDLEIFALEKTTGSYDALPGGKTLVGDLKEFSVPAAGTSLTEDNDYIG